MGIKYENTKIHWNYFLAIEKDFEVLSRYIEFSEANNNTFSIELARLIMSASQEVDVILKGICNLLVGKEPRNIDGYKEVVREHLPEIINEEVFISRYGMSSKSLINWNDDKNPDWWRANTDIKHHRSTNFEKANLKNAFNSIGALLIVNLYYYKLEIEVKEGGSIDLKDVVNSLDLITSFIKLKDEYYPTFIII